VRNAPRLLWLLRGKEFRAADLRVVCGEDCATVPSLSSLFNAREREGRPRCSAEQPASAEDDRMPISSNDETQRELTKRLVAGTPVIRSACDLDLLAFLHRHPRTLLTSEQLAGFVGYNLKDIAGALDGFIAAGLLARTAQQSTHAARLFVLLLDGPQGGGARALLELAATREGRRRILDTLNARGPHPSQPGAGPELRLVNSA